MVRMHSALPSYLDVQWKPIELCIVDAPWPLFFQARQIKSPRYVVVSEVRTKEEEEEEETPLL